MEGRAVHPRLCVCVLGFLYEWKVCIYKQNSQNFVTNMRKMRLLELLSYIFIVNLSTYKSDIETFSHLTLTWFLLDL